MGKSVWYRKGLRFECTHCGACCSGTPGLVEFTESEGRAMANFLGLEFEEFLARHATPTEEYWSLNETPALREENGYDCVLLERDPATGQSRCSVHPHRPTQCRTWPFWTENLESRRSWKKTARCCEGIGEGPVVSFHTIEKQRRETDVAANVRPRK